ncbi:MAG: hypothetical protein H0U69_02570 [Trueperaceae bacterium]|nr:hypothetical protein [Trueperaceae bacterium]
MRRFVWLLVLAALISCTEIDPTVSPPTISSFQATPEAVVPGAPVSLTWSVTGATTLVVEPEAMDVSGLVQTTVFPTETTTYTLVATNDVGERRRTVTVEVDDEVVGNGPVIVSFEPTMSLVNPGLPQTLTWNVVGAETLTLFGPGIEGGTVVTGTSTFGPTIDLPPSASFTLVAENSAGDVSAVAIASRAVPAFTVLVAGQSNAQGVNVSATAARDAISAEPGVEMFGNDYVWKAASEPLDDCLGQVDLVSLDSKGTGCPNFTSNASGLSFGVSLGNELSQATGGDVFLIPSARGGSSAQAWARPVSAFNRATLFGSAAFRAHTVGVERSAPIGHSYAGAASGVIAWFQGETDTSDVGQTNNFFSRTDAVFDGFDDVLGAPIVFAQLTRRGPTGNPDDPDGENRNLLYQRVREVQRRMASGARMPNGSLTSEGAARRHMVVTHDLPLHAGDGRHLSADAQIELGRRISLAVREHLLGEAGVDGTGPRLVAIDKVSPTVVEVRADRPVTSPASMGATAYSGYFRVFADGAQVAISAIERKTGDATTVRITLGQSVPGAVEVRYMPPAGALASVSVDVIRSATCTESMPGLGVCLPMPAFGMGTDAVTSARLSTLRFDDTE